MPYQFTDQGVQTQTLNEIKSELEFVARAIIHPQLDVSETSPIGQLIGIFAEREYLVQQLTRAVWQSRSPKGATGASLADICLLTGTVKRGQTYSQVGLTVTLTAGTTLPAGSRANVNGDTTVIFATVADVTNSSGITADIAATAQAINPGPVRAASGSLTVINTPVAGWVAVTNPFDADIGLDFESDVDLRLRREEELRVQGSTVLLAIEADVGEVTGVVQVRGFENTSSTTDIDGVAGHSFEIVVWDGVSPAANNNEVAQAIFDGAPAGIQAVNGTAGTHVTATAVDTTGASQTVLFTRASQKTLYIAYTLVTSSDYPVDGDTQVTAAAVASANAMLGVGDDVIITKLYAPAYSITGVLDVVAVKIGFTASPTGTANLTVGSREIAIADTSRVTVSS